MLAGVGGGGVNEAFGAEACTVGGSALYCGDEPAASTVGGTLFVVRAAPQRTQWD
ncbi:hypothetical protein KSC_032860 [Ktedonobacter sp. SOSP1-52]|nr:hypothetical protein KSC_032860 [Ktedonobacter sp. SOSP1-52]